MACSNYIKGDSEGVNVAGLINYSGNVNSFLFQYGTLTNVVKKFSEEAFVLQIGLINKLENKYFPLINAKGWKNLPRLIKKGVTKIDQTIEDLF